MAESIFLKCEIFDNPIKLRHLAYPKILSELIDHLSNPEVCDQNALQLKMSLQFLNTFLNIIDQIESDEGIKIICWKSSLGIPFTQHEINIDTGLEVKITRNRISLLDETRASFLPIAKELTNIDLKIIDKTKLDDKTLERLDLLISITQNILQITKWENVEEVNKTLQNDLSKMLKLCGYGSGKNAMTKNDTKHFAKTLNLSKSLNWIFSGIGIYPHETISRYPILIDGKLSTELYVEHSSKLKILIQNVRKTCDEIKQHIQ